MRKSREEAAETRARIIRKASKEFNQHGIAGTGLADVMKSAGLTHGGFYKHFQSKDELVAEALERGLEKSLQAMEHSADERTIAELVTEYLSSVHRDDFDNACPLPALRTYKDTAIQGRNIRRQAVRALADLMLYRVYARQPK